VNPANLVILSDVLTKEIAKDQRTWPTIKAMPDLFDFFKKQEPKLYERPPEQVWSKLERRLEKRRRGRRRGIRFLQLVVVALILLLLLLAAVMVWHYARRGAMGRLAVPGTSQITATTGHHGCPDGTFSSCANLPPFPAAEAVGGKFRG
jgi:hypothetical protein